MESPSVMLERPFEMMFTLSVVGLNVSFSQKKTLEKLSYMDYSLCSG